MENQKQERFDLESLQPKEIAEHDRVKKQFVSTMMKIHKLSEDETESIYEKELIYYKKALTESPKLHGCTKMTLYAAFLEIAITGLSIQPGAKSEAYLEARGTKVGKDPKTGSDMYTDACRFVITAYGELNLRIRSGQIIRVCNPIVIYEVLC